MDAFLALHPKLLSMFMVKIKFLINKKTVGFEVKIPNFKLFLVIQSIAAFILFYRLSKIRNTLHSYLCF